MIEPYYSQDGITIYNADCREVLPLQAHAVITDPPYGISDAPFRTGKRKGKREGGDNHYHDASDWDHSIDPEWCRLVCESAECVFWFGHWRKRVEVESYMTHPIRAEIIWAKDCHVGPPCPLAMRDERIWLFSKSGFTGARFDTTVWDEPIIPTWAHKRHKNEKPESLMRRIIRFASPQSILDPFMGSGTTLAAAKLEGKTAVGIEINEAYCEAAVKRLCQQVFDFT